MDTLYLSLFYLSSYVHRLLLPFIYGERNIFKNTVNHANSYRSHGDAARTRKRSNEVETCLLYRMAFGDGLFQ